MHMKITCSQKDLQSGLDLVRKAAAQSQAIAIVTAKDVLLENDDGRLKLTCANNQESGISIVTWIDAKIEGNHVACLPVRLLYDLVKNLQEDSDIQLDVLDQPMGAKLTQGTVESKIYGHDPDDFNKLEITDVKETARFRPDVLREALQRVLPAIATDDNRPILKGVKMDLKEDKFTLAAADGYRLAVETGFLSKASPETVDVVLPGEAMKELRGLIDGELKNFVNPSDANDIELMAGDDQNQLVFKMGDVQMVTLLMPGSFPNYSKLIPTENKTKISVPLDELQSAIKISNTFVQENNGIIRFVAKKSDGGEGNDGTLKVIAKSEDTGENEIELPAVIEGDDIRCAFNCRFLTALTDSLVGKLKGADLENKQAVFTTLSASSAGLFKRTELDEYDHVIMPMFVQW